MLTDSSRFLLKLSKFLIYLSLAFNSSKQPSSLWVLCVTSVTVLEVVSVLFLWDPVSGTLTQQMPHKGGSNENFSGPEGGFDAGISEHYIGIATHFKNASVALGSD